MKETTISIKAEVRRSIKVMTLKMTLDKDKNCIRIDPVEVEYEDPEYKITGIEEVTKEVPDNGGT